MAGLRSLLPIILLLNSSSKGNVLGGLSGVFDTGLNLNRQCTRGNTPISYSCENTTAIDTCCLTYPGGLVLQTQFWSTWTGLERQGQLLPKGSWTIHGLWPDNCDG